MNREGKPCPTKAIPCQEGDCENCTIFIDRHVDLPERAPKLASLDTKAELLGVTPPPTLAELEDGTTAGNRPRHTTWWR